MLDSAVIGDVAAPALQASVLAYGLSRSVKAFVEAGAEVDNLFVAAALGRLDLMEQLLAQGVDIDARYPEGGYGTALHAAAAMGQAKAVELLLARGADASLHNRWEATPADTAWHCEHRELAERIERLRKK